MNEPAYKYCSVPLCKNSTLRNPDKLFIHVPKSKDLRKKWLTLARRDPKYTSDKSTIYFCKDHFNLPEDMENYMEYHIMNSVKKIRLKAYCLPSKFSCQPDRLKRTAQSISRSASIKRQRIALVQEAEMALEDSATFTPAGSIIDTARSSSATDQADELAVKFKDKLIQACPDTENKHVQALFTARYRSKSTQNTVAMRNRATSPIASHSKSIATSPFQTSLINPSLYGRTKYGCRKKLNFISNTATASSPSVQSLQLGMSSDASCTSSPSIQSLQLKLTSDSEPENKHETDLHKELHIIREKKEKQDLCQASLRNTLRVIKTNPRFYIGVPKQCYNLVNIIQTNTKVPEEHILLCLSKIRLDTPFSQLGDQFGISLSYASKIFKNNIPILAKKLCPFIIKPDITLKQNLPSAFRHKYHYIYCIIDCLEIEIQKPSRAIHQALTWSDYKKANTIKYLISCCSTADGIVNYISPGFAGRISDVSLMENCKFLDSLPPGVSILADRGFKHVEQLLLQKGYHLVRPPSVLSNSKLSKLEARKTKEIASLRIHIERVIRRIREFSILKPHSVVNAGVLKHLDEYIIIACALINIQDSLIKNK